MLEVLMYYKEGCPFCIKAKKLLLSKGVNIEEVDITLSDENKKRFLKDSNNAKTVPQILINGNLIGGCDSLMALEESGKLDTILQL